MVDMLSRDHDMHIYGFLNNDTSEPQSLLLSRPPTFGTLQENRGDNTFAEIAQYSNVEASSGLGAYFSGCRWWK